MLSTPDMLHCQAAHIFFSLSKYIEREEVRGSEIAHKMDEWVNVLDKHQGYRSVGLYKPEKYKLSSECQQYLSQDQVKDVA